MSNILTIGEIFYIIFLSIARNVLYIKCFLPFARNSGIGRVTFLLRLFSWTCLLLVCDNYFRERATVLATNSVVESIQLKKCSLYMFLWWEKSEQKDNSDSWDKVGQLLRWDEYIAYIACFIMLTIPSY